MVFYTGKRAYPNTEPLSYLGLAIVGEVSPVTLPDGREQMQSSFYYFTQFNPAVPFSIDGLYLESAANSLPYPSLHFRQGVRKLSIEDLYQIVKEAESKKISADSSPSL